MLDVRRATDSDSHDLWVWRNDPATRAVSLSSEYVTWEDHVQWFNRTNLDDLKALYIGEISSALCASVGMCRFDIDPNSTSAEVSINLNPDHRGKQLSELLLHAAIEKFHDSFPDTTELTATIKESNAPSKKLFLAVGFSFVRQEIGAGKYSLSLSD